MTTEYGALTYRTRTTPAQVATGFLAELRRFVAGALFAAAIMSVGTVVAGFTLLALVLAAPVIAMVLAFAVTSRRRAVRRALA
jgi:hypothetical protein